MSAATDTDASTDAPAKRLRPHQLSLVLFIAIAGHAVSWPCAKGGSRAITDALAALLEAHGGVIERDRPVDDLADLPDHGVAIFDTSPRALARVAGDALPAGYRDRLERFRYGPGVFKIDYALSGSIPWTDPVCAGASTVHVGGTFDEIAASERAAWRGEVCDRPFVMVCQQSAMDDSRAPPGQHTGYAYCHVPAGCDVDMTAAIEAQLERFAPGFSDLILARHTLAPKDLEGRNRNCIGGAITGGAADLRQLFTRPVARLRPHTTPNPRIFLCSASTPPGGGVHGMGGYWAARAACRQLGLPMPPLSPEG